MRPWKLAELTYAHVKQQEYEVAVIPLGCTEPHNLHLPYGTDSLEAEVIGDHICESACEAGATSSSARTGYGSASSSPRIAGRSSSSGCASTGWPPPSRATRGATRLTALSTRPS